MKHTLMLDDLIPPFVIGLCSGLVFAMIVMSMPFTPYQQGVTAIAECEKDLPRSQVCIITAIPKEKEERNK